MSLGEATDRLPALSGLAKIYESRLKCRYLAGHWETGFLKSLCWSGARESQHTIPEYIAPSWSWASTLGYVDTSLMSKDVYTRDLTKVLDVSDVSIVPSKAYPTGEFSSGLLKLYGPMKEFEVDPERGWIPLTRPVGISSPENSMSIFSGMTCHCDAYPDSNFVLRPDHAPENSEGTDVDLHWARRISLLPLTVSVSKLDDVTHNTPGLRGIMLQRKEETSDVYVRVGNFECSRFDRRSPELVDWDSKKTTGEMEPYWQHRLTFDEVYDLYSKEPMVEVTVI
ncbi:hypothetical protein F4677DRAFT_463690 [Hypoxylon crocopeplum]|nr:hypothetical protein F4677DRAFT_463690 [Hypoxylon crocopeplum]